MLARMGPVPIRGVAWGAVTAFAALAFTEASLLPAVASSSLTGPAQAVIVLLVGSGIRAALGAFVCWRALRTGTDAGGAVLAALAGAAVGLLAARLATWVLVAAPTGMSGWAAELGWTLAGLVVWGIPWGLGAWWTGARWTGARA